ncbi:MAG TPA: NAD(P)/FAD-dependent oxidoreductase [Spirochaetota bacterium]|jgi:glycerol-3-phosphate dehydrogenase|nr:MAG: Anaerobic glycerol-3-phosphate dehydrogenase subunit A [Spirochaetes bacterium ADurb.Bin133]HNZ26022.1 NAD(P)/FAD-dependent oxidoreductase [Spirochaetota bacterium]HPY86833.1 NAD(P)/FAD-dependent oxidoreductase [Spirochaetota bacterium]
MRFDVAIIGAGVIGACIARNLSQYNLDVVLLEKEADVSFGTSKANSGIIHGGFHSDARYLKSALEIKGNLMFDQLHKELGFPFKRTGVIVAAFNEEELRSLETLYRQGTENGSHGIELCGRERILTLEPKLNTEVIGGLHAPIGGIIEPYRFVFSLVESAKKNGVELKTCFTVDKAESNGEGFKILSKEGGVVESRFVVNAAGLYADEISGIFGAEEYEIIPRKGEEYLLDKNSSAFTGKVIFPTPSRNSKGILAIPTVEGTMMIGPTAIEIEDKTDLSTSLTNLQTVFNFAKKLVPLISEKDIITSFAGIRPALPGGDFYIEESKKKANFIQVAGIQSPGLTASPAIALLVKDILKKIGLRLTEKANFDPYIEQKPKARHLSFDKLAEVIDEDPNYGNIVCRCESISEAEIIEAIQAGHTTLDGIKFYARAGMGRCQGGFCSYKIIKILMRETGMKFDEITKRGGDSFIIKGEL